MAKRKVRRQGRSRALPSGKQRVITILLLVASLTATTVILAQRSTLWPTLKPTTIKPTANKSATVQPLAPTGLTPDSPSKEYIYAGNRLIATEESPGGATLPPAPTGLTATAGNAQVSLTWNASAGAAGYNVKRSTTNGGPYTQIATGILTTSFTNTGLTNGTTYYYVVAAVNSSGGEGANSNQASATPTSGASQTPFNTTGTPWAIPGRIEAENFDNGGETIAYHDIDAGNNGGAYRSTDVDLAACVEGGFEVGWAYAGEWLEYTVNINSTQNYNFQARLASNGQGGIFHYEIDGVNKGAVSVPNTGSWSAYQTFTLSSVSLPVGTHILRVALDSNGPSGAIANFNYFDIVTGAAGPSPPTGLTATAGNAQVSLSWGAPAGATSYAVKRSTTSGGPYTTIASGITTKSYINTGLTNGVTYYYVVSAFNAAGGESANSAQVSATPGGSPTTPPAPTGLTATAGNAQVSLTWNASAGAAGYNVKRSTTSGGPYAAIALGVSTTSFTNTGLTNGTNYYYVVAAINSSGVESANSNQASATPTSGTLPPPPPPASLTATAGNAQVSLSWSASTGAANYRVKRATIDGGPYGLITTVTAPATSYTDTSAANEVTYYYVVTALNSTGGESTNSPQASARPLPPPPSTPTGLAATAGDGTVSLTWSASSGASSYRVKRATISGGPYVVVGTSSTPSHTDVALTNGTTYYYVVSALNAGGESGNSSQVSATPTASGGVCNTISLLSGSGSYGYAEGVGAAAKWKAPYGGSIGKDPVSGYTSLFVADTEGHRIRMIYLEGPNVGKSILIAGTGTAGYSEGGGNALMALYNNPHGVYAYIDANGTVSELLVADTDNHLIRKVRKPLTASSNWRSEWFSGQISGGFADGTAANSLYLYPRGVVFAADGNWYVTDSGNGRIRRLNGQGASSTLVSGFTTPAGITSNIDQDLTPTLYFTDMDTHDIWKVTTAGALTKIAGGGTPGLVDAIGTAARFNKPYQLVATNAGSWPVLYIADRMNYRVRKLDITTRTVTTFAGSGTSGAYQEGSCSTARFSQLRGVAATVTGEVYIIDTNNNRIRKAQ